MADPIATGTFAATPLANVLVYTRNKRLTGKLVIEAPDGRGGAIDTWRGRIVSVTTKPPIAYLGAIVYELGWIDAPTLDATLLLVAKDKRLHGEILVERGAITKAQRDEALVEQACRKVHHFFSLPDATKFAFFDARASVDEPPVLLDPLAPAWRGLRDYPPEKTVREVLGKFPSSVLRVVNESPLSRIGFGAEEKALVDELLFHPMTIAQLRSLGKTSAQRADLVAFLLIVGKCVEPVSPSQAGMNAVKPQPESSPRLPSTSMRAAGTPGFPSSGEVRMRPPSFRVPSVPKIAVPTPSPSSPRIQAAVLSAVLGPAELGPTGVAARATRLETETHYEALGLEDGASVDAVRAAYFRLAKVWHPDRIPSDLAPWRSEIESIFSHMTNAHKMLTDPEAREKAPTKAKRARADIIREIDHALAKKEWAFAEGEARTLCDDDADDAEARAVMAWSAAAGGEAKKEMLEASLAQLDKIVNTDRFCDRAFYYRGALHKRLGNTAGAVRDFARALSINPKNIDAEREVRLAEMRARKGSGEHALGLFGKTKK